MSYYKISYKINEMPRNGSVSGLVSSGAQLQCFRAIWQFCFRLHVYNCPESRSSTPYIFIQFLNKFFRYRKVTATVVCCRRKQFPRRLTCSSQGSRMLPTLVFHLCYFLSFLIVYELVNFLLFHFH